MENGTTAGDSQALICYNLLKLSSFTTLNGVMELSVFTVALLFITCSNCMLLYGLFRTKDTKNNTSKLLAVVSIGDLLLAWTVIPIHEVLANVLFTSHCDLVYSVENGMTLIIGVSNALLILCIGIDRYAFMRKPFFHNKYFRRSNSIKLTVLVSYTLSLTMVVCLHFFFIDKNFNTKQWLNSALLIISLVVLFGSLSLNVVLVRFIRHQTAVISRLSSNTTSRHRYQQKATKTVTYISISQTVTYLPVVIFFAYSTVIYSKYHNINGAGDKNTFLYHLYIWLRMPLFFNSGMNATIYLLRDRNIMAHYKGRCRSVSPV